MEKIKFKTVEEYMKHVSPEERENLEKIREIVKKTVPEAEEVLSYQMPTFKYYGYLIYYAAFKDHYSIFMPPHGVYEMFEKELAPYNVSKATIQFPKDQPIPFDLIARLVKVGAEKNKSSHGKEY